MLTLWNSMFWLSNGSLVICCFKTATKIAHEYVQELCQPDNKIEYINCAKQNLKSHCVHIQNNTFGKK